MTPINQPRNNVWKYEAKISALKSDVPSKLSTLRNKTDRFMEIFNKTISNFETKPYEVLQDNIEFLQNKLRSKDEIINSNRCSGKSTFNQTTPTNRKQHHIS